MVNTLKVEDVLLLVRQAKCRNRRTASMKILQWEFVNGKPKMILQTMDTVKVIDELEKLGYTVTTEKTDKQVSVNYKCNGSVSDVRVRNLHTTNLVVKW